MYMFVLRAALLSPPLGFKSSSPISPPIYSPWKKAAFHLAYLCQDVTQTGVGILLPGRKLESDIFREFPQVPRDPQDSRGTGVNFTCNPVIGQEWEWKSTGADGSRSQDDRTTRSDRDGSENLYIVVLLEIFCWIYIFITSLIICGMMVFKCKADKLMQIQ